MPTYEYKCSTCDQALDVYQPLEDGHLKVCPENGECPQPGQGQVCRNYASVKLVDGFIGAASTNPKMEQFWETGDPELVR